MNETFFYFFGSPEISEVASNILATLGFPIFIRGVDYTIVFVTYVGIIVVERSSYSIRSFAALDFPIFNCFTLPSLLLLAI